MKGITYIWLTAITLAGLALSPATAQESNAQQQPLGDYARTVRKEKKQVPARSFDNDNLPANEKISVVGGEATSTSQAPSPATAGTTAATTAAPAGEPAQDGKGAAKQMPTVTPGESQQNRQQVYDQWKSQLSDKKQQIDLLARELDVLQREYRLRAAAIYSDVGNRMRNSSAWDKEDAEYKQKIAEKQKALDDAKKDMEDMQEDARKSGVPSSVRE